MITNLKIDMKLVEFIKYQIIRKLICKIFGHKWTDWWGIQNNVFTPVNHHIRVCLRCTKFEEKNNGI